MSLQGFGATQANLIVYCANTPTTTLLQPKTISAICYQDIEIINADNGNGWRKIFNVYAKLLFEIDPLNFKTWQALRNEYLLQAHCSHQLILNPDSINFNDPKQIHILMGKTFGLFQLKKHFKDSQIEWLEPNIAKVKNKNIYIVPYFDYRQFSNAKIELFSKLLLR